MISDEPCLPAAPSIILPAVDPSLTVGMEPALARRVIDANLAGKKFRIGVWTGAPAGGGT
jgi:hypothetical protein